MNDIFSSYDTTFVLNLKTLKNIFSYSLNNEQVGQKLKLLTLPYKNTVEK